MPSRDPERNRAGLLFGILAVVVVVACVIGTLAATRRFTSHVAAGSKAGVLTAPRHIDTVRTADLYCPSSPSFSSDGSRFAVLGTGIPCTDPAAVLPGKYEHKLAIYDASNGALQRVVELDPFFQLNTIQGCAGVQVQALQYTSLGWSPDGEHFAVLYAAFDYAAYNTANALSPDDLVCSGLLLLEVDSDTAVSIPGDSGFFDGATGTYAGYPTWDLTGLTSSPPTAISSSLVYGWSEVGQPQSVSPLSGGTVNHLPARAGPGYPVGDPNSDSTYTIWQPGIVAGPLVFSDGAASVTEDDIFVTEFPTWIPSGQYVTMLAAGVELPPQDSQYQLTSVMSPSAVPLLPLPPEFTQVPARDPALVALQRQIGPTSWAMTAWNDQGTTLASINCSSAASSSIELRETSGGTLIGTQSLGLGPNDPGCSIFNFSQALGDYPNPNLSLQWSPDGSDLLLSDQTASTLTLWSVASSPQ
ncbi:MAG: hypothetical protein ACLQUY_13160 [Ktedonobacterales bacterium]